MDPLYVKGLREAKGLLDAGTISAEDFEKEKRKLLSEREERERQEQEQEERRRKRPFEDEAATTTLAPTRVYQLDLAGELTPLPSATYSEDYQFLVPYEVHRSVEVTARKRNQNRDQLHHHQSLN